MYFHCKQLYDVNNYTKVLNIVETSYAKTRFRVPQVVVKKTTPSSGQKIHTANHPRVDRAPQPGAPQNDRRDIPLLSLILSIRAFLRWNVRTRTKMFPTQLSNFRGHFHETRVQRRNHFVNHFLQTKKNSVCTVQ